MFMADEESADRESKRVQSNLSLAVMPWNLPRHNVLCTCFLSTNKVQLWLVPMLLDFDLQAIQEVVEFLWSSRDTGDAICRSRRD